MIAPNNNNSNDPPALPGFLLDDTPEKLIIGDIARSVKYGEFLPAMEKLCRHFPDANKWINEELAIIYGACLALYRDGVPVTDAVTIGYRCEQHGANANMVYSILKEHCPIEGGMIDEHIRQLENLSNRRELYRHGTRLINDAGNMAIQPQQTAAEATKALGMITEGDAGPQAPSAAEHSAATRNCADIESKEVDWLWLHVFPLGMVSMVCGDPGLNKSTMLLDITARVSTGNCMPDGTPGVCGQVLLLNAEDAVEQTIIPRLNAAGADRTKIHLLDGRRLPDGTSAPITLEDIPIIRDALVQHPGTRLVVIDPVSAYLGRADSHVNSDVRALLRPLALLAETHNCAFIILSHLTKNAGTKVAYRATGSLAFTALSRSAWVVCEDKEVAPNGRILACIKSNVGPSDRGFRFRRQDDGRLEWEPLSIETTAQKALAEAEGTHGEDDTLRGPPPAARNAAAVWLENLLRNEPVLAAKVLADGKLAGFKESTIQRAANALNVKRERDCNTNKHRWSLPANPPPDRQLENLESTNNLTTWKVPQNKGDHNQKEATFQIPDVLGSGSRTAPARNPKPDQTQTMPIGLNHQSSPAEPADLDRVPSYLEEQNADGQEILSKVVDGSKSGGLFFNSIFELDSRQYVGNQFRAVESLKASLGALA